MDTCLVHTRLRNSLATLDPLNVVVAIHSLKQIKDCHKSLPPRALPRHPLHLYPSWISSYLHLSCWLHAVMYLSHLAYMSYCSYANVKPVWFLTYWIESLLITAYLLAFIVLQSGSSYRSSQTYILPLLLYLGPCCFRLALIMSSLQSLSYRGPYCFIWLLLPYRRPYHLVRLLTSHLSWLSP